MSRMREWLVSALTAGLFGVAGIAMAEPTGSGGAPPEGVTLDARTTPASTRAPVLPPGVSARDLPDFALFRDCAQCPDMVVIPGGSFLMGSPRNDTERLDGEGDTLDRRQSQQISVSIPRFAMARFETTRDEFKAYLAATKLRSPGNCAGRSGDLFFPFDPTYNKPHRSFRNPGFRQTPRDPAVCVSLFDARAFAGWMSSDSAGASYRLPSESEWEYAARAGTTTRFWTGDSIRTEQAHFTFASPGAAYSPRRVRPTRTLPVGSFAANPFGLFDTAGNAAELVEDCVSQSLGDTPRDGKPNRSGDCSFGIQRGGGWNWAQYHLRSAFRFKYARASTRDNSVGFRLARDL